MDEKIERTEQDKENIAVNSSVPTPEQKEDAGNDGTEVQTPAAEEPAPSEENAGAEKNDSAEEIVSAEEPASEGPASGEESASEEKSVSEEAATAGQAAEEPSEKEHDAREARNDEPLTLGAAEDEKEEAPAPEAPALPSGPAATLFRGLSLAGLPLLIILAAAMTFLEVWQVRDLWFSDEVRLADAFMNLTNGDWLMLTMNGLPYPDKPPLYFWFMKALTMIPGVTVPMVFFLAVAVSHALFIGSIWLLARGTGHDRREAFAAGLVALGCVYISGAACYPRMDLLFAAVVTLGMTCLYRGWIKSFAPFWLAAGFLLMGAATLIKSPLGIAFAVVTSILFLFWRGTPGRLNGRDGLPGFVLMLLMILAWLGALYLGGHQDYLRDMLGSQLAGRVLEGGHHAAPWWYYLAAVPVIWLPWILIILFVNWFAVLRGIPTVWKTRKTNGGSSWLWIWLVTGIAMLSVVQAKMAVYALPLLAPLAVLTGRSILRLTPGRSRCFFSLSSALLALAGLALVAIDVYPLVSPYIGSYLPSVPAVAVPWLENLEGTMYMGGVLILLAVVLLFFTRLALPGGALLITSLGMILMLQPYHAFVAPSMDRLLSPRAQAEVMAAKLGEGYTPAAFNVYPGAYAWHLNLLAPQAEGRLAVPDLATAADRDAWLKAHPRTVMAMPEADWKAWTDKPADAQLLLTAWMVHKPYVVAAITLSESAAPAPEAPAAEPSAAEAPAAAPEEETAAPEAAAAPAEQPAEAAAPAEDAVQPAEPAPAADEAAESTDAAANAPTAEAAAPANA